MVNRTSTALLALLLVPALLLLDSCKKEEEEPPPQYPPGQSYPQQGYPPAPGYPPGQGYPPPQQGYPPGQAYPPPEQGQPPQGPPPSEQPSGPPGSPPPAGELAPIAGFPCSSDSDFQCTFGRCVNNRCGGCRSEADCKAGAICSNTPLGGACIPAPGSVMPPMGPSQPPAQPPASGGSDPFAAARARCLSETNRYRAQASAPAVAQAHAKQSCADNQAKSDGQQNKPHGSFGQCSEIAQNECPGFTGNPEAAVQACLKLMFDEGPGEGPAHGHYTNMTNPSYTQVACGFFVTPEGNVWIVQNFHR